MTIPSIKKVEIQITTACNMKCGFCFADAGRNLSLPVALANKVASQLAEKQNGNSDEKSLWLTGGEALLTDACQTLVETARGLGIKTGVATNGLLLARKAALLRAAGLQEVRVSLDSVRPNIFDQMRGTHKALPRVLQGIETAASNGLKTGIRFTAMRNNSEDIRPVIQRAQNLGASYVEVKAVLPIGRGSSSLMLPPDLLNGLMNEAVALSTPGMSVYVLCSYLSPCKGYDLGPSHIPCICATDAMYVAVNGDLMPCSYFPQTSPFNISQHSLREAWRSNDFAQVRNNRPDECQPCETWEPCRNGCPALTAHHDTGFARTNFILAEQLRLKGRKLNECARANECSCS